ncbi:uncharacterized protein V6R79_004080 [Siganus canaliculatus]
MTRLSEESRGQRCPETSRQDGVVCSGAPHFLQFDHKHFDKQDRMTLTNVRHKTERSSRADADRLYNKVWTQPRHLDSEKRLSNVKVWDGVFFLLHWDRCLAKVKTLPPVNLNFGRKGIPSVEDRTYLDALECLFHACVLSFAALHVVIYDLLHATTKFVELFVRGVTPIVEFMVRSLWEVQLQQSSSSISVVLWSPRSAAIG